MSGVAAVRAAAGEKGDHPACTNAVRKAGERPGGVRSVSGG